LAAIASNAKAEEVAREEAEKQRTLRCVLVNPQSEALVSGVPRLCCCSEFEEARRAIAEAERRDAEARRTASANFRAALDVQRTEKQARTAGVKEAEHRQQELLQV
jgi:hypothetical protein